MGLKLNKLILIIIFYCEVIVGMSDNLLKKKRIEIIDFIGILKED